MDTDLSAFKLGYEMKIGALFCCTCVQRVNNTQTSKHFNYPSVSTHILKHFFNVYSKGMIALSEYINFNIYKMYFLVWVHLGTLITPPAHIWYWFVNNFAKISFGRWPRWKILCACGYINEVGCYHFQNATLSCSNGKSISKPKGQHCREKRTKRGRPRGPFVIPH